MNPAPPVIRQRIRSRSLNLFENAGNNMNGIASDAAFFPPSASMEYSQSLPTAQSFKYDTAVSAPVNKSLTKPKKNVDYMIGCVRNIPPESSTPLHVRLPLVGFPRVRAHAG
jgi:hypothetical protein